MLSGLGGWAPWVYMAMFAVLPAFFFPVAVLALAGGVAFGLWQGALYTFIGAVVNCTLMFWMARRFGREKIEEMIEKRLDPQWRDRLAKLEGREGFLLLIVLRLILLLAIALVLAAYFAIPGFHSFVNEASSVLSTANTEAVVEYIRSFGPKAMVLSFALMVFSSILAPLPAILITLANAAIFGWWQGAILSWSSAMVGAALCFFLARGLGRGVVEKLAGKAVLDSVEGYFKKYGTRTILVCRLLPFVSFDAVSYFAGLTPMGFLAFFVATGIGQTPATIVYSYVGGMLTGGAKLLMIGLLCLFSLAILIGIIRQLYTDRQAKKANG